MTRLPPRRESYCVKRAAGLSSKDAARAVGVSEPTAWRWNADPAVRDRIAALQDAAGVDAVRALRAKARRAAERVAELMEPGHDVGGTAPTNLRASIAVLTLAGVGAAEKREVAGQGGGALVFTVVDHRP